MFIGKQCEHSELCKHTNKEIDFPLIRTLDGKNVIQ